MTKRTPIIVCLLLLIFTLWLILTGNPSVRHVITRVENLGYDIQLRAHIIATPPMNLESAPVVIVDIDDKSIQAEGHWPWSRSTLAKLIDNVKALGAVVISMDMFFAEKEDNIANEVMRELAKHNQLNSSVESTLTQNLALFNDDARFVKSISDAKVVVAYTFLPRAEMHNALPKPLLTLSRPEEINLDITSAQGYISNIPAIQNAASASGFINIFPDEDGIVRHAPLIIQYHNDVYPSLALQTVMSYLSNNQATLIAPGYLDQQRLEGVKLGGYTIPTDQKGFVLIPFIGRSYDFPYFSASDVLNGRIPADTFVGKIVFIGTSATGLGDLQPASVQNPFPGVEIQASITNGILTKSFSYRPAWTLGLDACVTFLLGLLAALLFPYLGPRALALIIIFFPIVILYVNGVIWRSTGLVLSFLAPVILVTVDGVFNLLYGYLFETRRREQLKAMFGQYVPENHINEMLRSNDKFSLHGENKEMTVMFADIRNFTTISENMSATDLVDMLNTYFTPMTEIIHQHLGTVDKYIGDLIMAFWGAPLHDADHASNAIKAALHMQAKLAELRQLQLTKQWPDIVMGIGINSGKMNVGDMGSQFRRNYTVLGDAVNLASRIEGLTKYYEVYIIVTENTERDQADFVFRTLDRVQVKGRAEGIDIYEVICEKAALTRELADELHSYHNALDLYRKRHFNQAKIILETLQAEHPDTKIYTLYIERIDSFLNTPPDDAWDATYVHSAK